jgi:hypothetical protein
MRFVISFGAFPRDLVNSFDLLGAEWAWSPDETGDKWIEIHLLGFILYFDFMG